MATNTPQRVVRAVGTGRQHWAVVRTFALIRNCGLRYSLYSPTSLCGNQCLRIYDVAILLIEDDEGVRQSLSEVLRDEGYAVQAVQDGVEALRWLERNLPSLILLDLMLPWINGVDFAKEIRQNERLAKTPLVVLSARPDVRERAQEAHADDWLSKPMSFEELLHVVQNLAVTEVGEIRL